MEFTTRSDAADSGSAAQQNPLLTEWTGNYGGTPLFDRVNVADFKSAIAAAMAENLAEIEQIAANPAAANFENTIAQMERAGRQLDRVLAVYGVWSSAMNTPEFQAVDREMSPKLAEFFDKITQNERLFQRIEAVYRAPEKADLNAEQQRLTWLYYNNFVLAGAELQANEKTRLSEINQRLATLFTNFSQNLLADENEHFLVLKSEAELAGLPPSLRDAAAEEAKAKNLAGAWVVSNTRSLVDPFLTYADRRDLREKAWRMFVNRGNNDDAHDNKQIIREILQLRHERAELLGFPTHAHWRLADKMAKTPERTMELMEAVWQPAVARVREEVADMQRLADRENADIKIEPWDYRYYAEKVRKERYDLDQTEVKQYLQLENLRAGMFWVAGELFNFEFSPIDDVPVYHADVRVWEVIDKISGRHVGLWYFDPFARAGKSSGAWMNAYRNQEKFDGETTTIVSNNANFVKGKPDEPVLISWDDATTLFHEFGHALHGLASNVAYPSLSGTSVPTDYVEFPSQILERWLSTAEVLQKFAVHYQTGEPIPQTLVDRINRAETFNQGFTTVEYLASALVDMKLHLAGAEKIDPDAFERKTLAELGMPDEIVMRHRTAQFGHIFSSDGYSAGYYSYLWSDVISTDAYDAFVEAGSAYDQRVAARLRRYIFSVGNTIDPAEAYRLFRSRDPQIDALMRKRGFPVKNAEQNKSAAPN